MKKGEKLMELEIACPLIVDELITKIITAIIFFNFIKLKPDTDFLILHISQTKLI